MQRAQAAGVTWPLPASLDEMALEQLLFPASAPLRTGSPAAPDWAHIHHELTRKGVTLWLLWQE